MMVGDCLLLKDLEPNSLILVMCVVL